MMRIVKTILAEAWGLFVDDGYLAAAILVWLAVAWAVVNHFDVPRPFEAIGLFAGLVLILVDSAGRRAQRG